MQAADYLRALEQGDRRRTVIGNVQPTVDGGRFAVRRAEGEVMVVEADVFADGHDEVSCRLLHRHETELHWQEERMTPLGNDRWRAVFSVMRLGRHYYTIVAGVDHFGTWRRDLQKRRDANEDLDNALKEGAAMMRASAGRAEPGEAERLNQAGETLDRAHPPYADAMEVALSDECLRLMERYGDRHLWRRLEPALPLQVERLRARFGSWYEFFPRSCGGSGKHARLLNCLDRLRYVADLGFDVVYLPPIHPIGKTHRKGPNNAPVASSDDVGSPWAIGSEAGGHTAVHPALGTLEDFRAFRDAARGLGLEVALDIAFQCSPEHPYVQEHPAWFRRRADRTIQHAENPPKHYEDIYPLDFESTDAPALWQELLAVFLHWTAEDIRIFRVDNPHTKPFAFWEWVIGHIKTAHPDVIFLSEAFTRPRVMEHLAKVGFTQSYTYFTWRNSKKELTEYFTELAATPLREYFWPNAWPNTPDILPGALQHAAAPAFALRAVLAATLSANYGIYGPAFELCENKPMAPGSEEYLNSEKYELRSWDLDAPESLRGLLMALNSARHSNPALQNDLTLRFHTVDNEALICYSKHHETNVVVMVVNLDPHHTQSGWVDLALHELGLSDHENYGMFDLLSATRYVWHPGRNYVELDPSRAPAHVFELRRDPPP
ncbi:MAG: alpha-1,4-glucan--maltose-1-phosphate maltosyltransferase [Acidiferrobacteraceae bacterium]